MTTDHQGAEALDKCKHCGSGELFLNVYSHYVACERCGISTRDYDSVAEAIAAWNRRPAAGADGLPEHVARVYWTLHGPYVGWQSYKAMNAAILEGPQPERPLYTADQMRQYALDALAARAEKAPLSDKQIIRAWLDCTEPGCSATDAFVAGIRFAEKHHGIAPPSDSAADGGGEDRE